MLSEDVMGDDRKINDRQIEVSIVVPARNEEAALRSCLESLQAQQGVRFEILVVDDGSTDHTRGIAESFGDVMVLDSAPLPPGWSGKSNACLTGAKRATGEWLLFTDADTVHAPLVLALALQEAQSFGVAMLSYSPRQEAVTLLEKLVMPVIFAELVAAYNTDEINNPTSSMAAANGQYILIKRKTYWAIGGHAAVAMEMVEDVALAKLVKASGRGLRFRYEGGQVRTRMYRDAGQLVEGWSKNLHSLFPQTLFLAGLRAMEFLLIAGAAAGGLYLAGHGTKLTGGGAGILMLILYFNFLRRVRKAHFGALATAISFLGLPFFSFLLLRSHIKHTVSRSVEWKGRRYAVGGTPLDRAGAMSAPGRVTE